MEAPTPAVGSLRRAKLDSFASGVPAKEEPATAPADSPPADPAATVGAEGAGAEAAAESATPVVSPEAEPATEGACRRPMRVAVHPCRPPHVCIACALVSGFDRVLPRSDRVLCRATTCAEISEEERLRLQMLAEFAAEEEEFQRGAGS